MECPKCGYIIDAFTQECPRCKKLNEQNKQRISFPSEDGHHSFERHKYHTLETAYHNSSWGFAIYSSIITALFATVLIWIFCNRQKMSQTTINPPNLITPSKNTASVPQQSVQPPVSSTPATPVHSPIQEPKRESIQTQQNQQILPSQPVTTNPASAQSIIQTPQPISTTNNIPTAFKNEVTKLLEDGIKADGMTSEGVNYVSFSDQIATVRGEFNLTDALWPSSINQDSREEMRKALDGWELTLQLWVSKNKTSTVS